MLTAMRRDGTPFHLLPRLSKEVLRCERKEGEFYCPECKEQVLMKVGTHRIEHFAHQKGSRCVESYERESDYHLNGKLQLFHWLEAQSFHPEIEPFYDSIRQRPDIGVSICNQNIVFEFQCSVIPPELMMKRTKQYVLKNYKPIWIMGGKNIKRKGEKKISLSNFDYLFLTKNPSGSWNLPAYCATSKKFILLKNITPITSKNALAHISVIPIQQYLFRELLDPSVIASFTKDDWKKEIRTQKINFHLQGPRQNGFLKELYQCSLNSSLLPPIIGLPVQNAPVIETAPLIWQSYLFIDHFNKRKEGEVITFGEVYRSFMNRVNKKQIKLRQLPLAPNSNPTSPLSEYLHLLVQLDVLEGLNRNTFRIREKVVVPEHFVYQQQIEDDFYQNYGECLFK
ncbi:competence protein CoiA [Bacillus sp. V3B]|uniref:competence protein CoiA n=1 Tax=Bacillus sp. V3B TaxID=2804915 RepID=UPI00210D2027|nr:competence protein CoiA family protein [Bacillus sp. V3B]MCQ6274304.1 competence protein CoiA [Bacillus sp. V3B]